MYLATVVGQVWATRKDATLGGLRLLVVQPYLRGEGRAKRGDDTGKETMVAVDPIGADMGERVLVVMGRAARHAIGRGHDIGFQCAIVGVVDGAEMMDGEHVGQTAEGDHGPREKGA
jgi:ethanolamine utilization protein EutN